jgi:hypothetical protein
MLSPRPLSGYRMTDYVCNKGVMEAVYINISVVHNKNFTKNPVAT